MSGYFKNMFLATSPSEEGTQRPSGRASYSRARGPDGCCVLSLCKTL